MDKSCNICDFENVCLDEPADANECNSFRNIDFTKMENAIKIIEESEWLKEHDAEVISDERAKFVEWLHENYTVNDNHNEEVSVEDLLWEYSHK